MPAQTLATLYALAETAINTLVNGAAYTLPTSNPASFADIAIYFAPVGTTAPASGTILTLQGCYDTSDDKWFDLASVGTNATAAVTTTLNGATSAAATSITTAGSATFGARSKLLYFKDSTTVGEWANAQGHVTTTLTVPAPGLVNAHSNGISVYDQALRFYLSIPTFGLRRLRLQVDNNTQATGPTVAVHATIQSYQQ